MSQPSERDDTARDRAMSAVDVLEMGRARGCRFVRHAMVPMRDGVELATSIFLPETEGRYPVVVKRLPYDRTRELDEGEMWARNGYVYICQDTRGRYDSEGVFDPFVQEIEDTPDAIRWIRAQPWCNGQVGMMGPSYLAVAQTLGVTRGDGPMPDAILPTFAPLGGWQPGWYANGPQHGPLSLFLAFSWLCFSAGARTRDDEVLGIYDLPELLSRLPLSSLDVSSGGSESRTWQEVMDHPTFDPFWEKYGILDRWDRFTMPTLLVAGWYDFYPADMISDWHNIRAAADTPAAADSHRLLIGPWGHHHDFSDMPEGQCALDFGSESALFPPAIYLAWFDRVFKGLDSADGFGERPIRLFVMGRNEWRDEDEWPLARTRSTDLYLHSEGGANTLAGDGALELHPPDNQPADRYDYDPRNPVPTRGGNHSVGPWHPEYRELIWCGPCDQRPTEERPDVLVYTTARLDEDREVTGPVVLRLWASSSVHDTDFVARLVDVHPDGLAVNICEGVVRARYRNGDLTQPQLIEPGAVLEYSIDLHCTSNVFLKGHRVRLDITSSNFPLLDRNLNTGEHPNRGTALRTARQEIWHDSEHPSHLVLPVIPS
jgi:putative CocE/NonD family hydrolase